MYQWVTLFTLSIVILFFMPNVSNAATPVEIDEAKIHGENIGVNCGTIGLNDSAANREFNPQKAYDKFSTSNLYPEGELLAAYQEGVKKTCFPQYERWYYDEITKSGERAARWACVNDGQNDYQTGKEYDPQSSYEKNLAKSPPPYTDKKLRDIYISGFRDSCYAEYDRMYYVKPTDTARSDANKMLDKCRAVGFEDGKAGNFQPGTSLSNLAKQGANYNKYSNQPQERQLYVEAFTEWCTTEYKNGHKDGELEARQKSDEQLAREAGELLGIEEEEVIEFFGGEEKVKEAYEQNCIIATASFGSPLAKEVQMLREIRDNQLLQTKSGEAFMSGFNTIYYSFAPTVAQWEHENSAFKEVVKIAITPLITSLSLLNHVSMDSEAEVLGYGISLILLNIGMYFVAPATIFWQVKKRI